MARCASTAATEESTPPDKPQMTAAPPARFLISATLPARKEAGDQRSL